MLTHLFTQIGFGWAVRCLAFLMLVMNMLAFLAIRPKIPERASGPLFRLQFLKDRNYALWVLCMQCTSRLNASSQRAGGSRFGANLFSGFAFLVAAVYTPYFYDASFALSIGVDGDMAIYALSIMNASTLIGRLPPALLADR